MGTKTALAEGIVIWENTVYEGRKCKWKVIHDTLTGNERERLLFEFCIVCGGDFTNAHWRYRPRHVPPNICPQCAARGKHRKFVRMKKALDAIANVACVKGGYEDDCECPTCFAGRVYDELFAEYEGLDSEEEAESEGSGEDPDVHSELGVCDNSGGVPS